MKTRHTRHPSHGLRCGALPGTGVLLIIAASMAASAQAADSGAGTDAIQEIIVTAQRRGENLQAVPLSVSAITADDAARIGIRDTADLTAAVPGLDFSRQAQAATPFIRGVGSTSSLIGDEPSVAMYVDGVYISSAQASIFSLNNIDRIEVLKGPQGTLFGRNATGGVVQVLTKDPTQDTRVDVAAGYANYRTASASLYATTGIAPNLAADIALYGLNQSEGWGKDVSTGVDAFKQRDFSARTKWLWTPDEATRVNLSADFSVSQGEEGLGLSPLPGTLALNGVTGNNGFYNTADSPNDSFKTTQYGGSLSVTHDFGWATLNSISSGRRSRSPFYLDQDSSPTPIINADIQGRARSYSQEFQLLSPSAERIKWIGGLYYFNDRSGYQPLALSGFALQGLPYSDIYSEQATRSYAVYGQTTIPVIDDATHVTLGLRYTSDHRGIVGDTVVPLGPAGAAVPILQDSQSVTFNKPTWRFALDRQFSTDFLGYVSYNRGFKSGVYDTLSYANPVVKPEVLDAYEIGTKVELMDRRLRINTAVFDYQYSNIQVDQLEQGVSTLLNAAKAQLYGADLEITFLPAAGLTVSSSMEYLHGRYKSFPNAPLFTPSPTGGDAGSAIDAAGRTTVHSPAFTGNFSVNYSHALPLGMLDIAAGDYYSSHYYWNPDNRIQQGAFNLVNTSVTYTSASKNWDARLWGKNLFDRRYFSYATDQAFGDNGSPAPPLTYGITFGYHYR